MSIIADLKKQVEVLIDENKDLENTVADLRKHVNSLNQQMGELKDKFREKVQCKNSTVIKNASIESLAYLNSSL